MTAPDPLEDLKAARSAALDAERAVESHRAYIERSRQELDGLLREVSELTGTNITSLADLDEYLASVLNPRIQELSSSITSAVAAVRASLDANT